MSENVTTNWYCYRCGLPRTGADHDCVTALRDAFDALTEDLARAENAARDAEGRNSMAVCLYCGNVSEKSLLSMADHVDTCERHPINALMAAAEEINDLRTALRAAEERARELEANRRESVRVDVLLRYSNHIYRRMRRNGASGETSEEVAAYRLHDVLSRRSRRNQERTGE